jgi:signal transduction histidine kinase
MENAREPAAVTRRDLRLPAVLLVLQAAGALASAPHQTPPLHLGAGPWIVLVAGPLALLARRRYPVAVLWVTFALTLTPWTSWFANLSLIAAFLVTATGSHRRAAWVVIVVGYVSAVWVEPLAHGTGVSLALALALGGWLAGLVVAAETVRLRRERAADRQAARQLDIRRRVGEERLRMARDLHDVIGHHISLISVQAGVGLDLMDSQPEQARAALTAIRAVSKDALDELRAMLAALRADDETAPRSPAAGVARLPELIGHARAAGLTVRTEVAGEPAPLPVAVDLAAYRIIAESLTNVARHASRSTAVVRLRYESATLVIEVLDDGPAAAPGGSPPGAGSGIMSMRDRARALGGSLAAGPRPGGGFAVTARLPLRPAGQPDPAGQAEPTAHAGPAPSPAAGP